MSLPPGVAEYSGFAALAGVGSVARGKQWVGPDGKFLTGKFVAEAATAVGIAAVVIAGGAWKHLDPSIMAGLCVVGGWLGPATVSDLLLSRFGLGKKG